MIDSQPKKDEEEKKSQNVSTTNSNPENIFRVFSIFSCHLLIFPPSTISEKKEEITAGPTTPHKAQWSVAARAAAGSSSALASHRSWCVPRRAISIQMREQ
jgi:hypothetical protein